MFHGSDSSNIRLPDDVNLRHGRTTESLMTVKNSQQIQSDVDFESTGRGFSDARLVEECRRGDQSAFGELVIRYERRLLRVIGRFIRDADIAEDLAQETFLRVYERLDQYDASRRFGPWLFRIGVNLTLDYLRKKKRRGFTALFTDRSTDRWFDPGIPDPATADRPASGGPPGDRRRPGKIPDGAGVARPGELLDV